MNDGNEKELWERLTAAEASAKSAHHRLDGIEKLTQSVSDMVVEVKHMREDLNNVHDEIEEVKSRPMKFVDKFIWAFVGAAASAIVSLVMSQIF